MRTRVYIAGPISRGDLAANIRQASAAFFALLRAGFAPLCPHWSCFSGTLYRPLHASAYGPYAFAETLPEGTTHEDWLAVALPWVACAEAVIRLPGVSAGADRETALARAKGIPVFASVADLVAWAKESGRG